MASSSSQKFKLLSKLSCAIVFFVFVSTFANATLEVGFYASSCPDAEGIIKNAVQKAVSQNPGIAAGLIRMHFHDCFVRGCDGSVLLKSTPETLAEREHPANFPSLRGFEVIDEAKAQIEAICPNTVSCADILAFAARDSACNVGGIDYAVPAGRRDGRISIRDEASSLPLPSFNAKNLTDSFAQRGLSTDEMVTLSGAHSIGVAHCPTFSNRLYSFNSTHSQDPSMDPNYAAYLKTKCPPPSSSSGSSQTVVLEPSTPNRLDNRYYVELTRRRGLLSSDQTLLGSYATSRMVLENARHGYGWANKFGKAMVKMGSIGVLTGPHEGEIRHHCSVVN